MTAAKAVAAAIGVLVTVVTGALADNAVSIPEWGEIVATAVVGSLTVYGVWRTPNRPAMSSGPVTPRR